MHKIFFLGLIPAILLNAQKQALPVSVGDGPLTYHADSLNNRIPDFSYAGYTAGNEDIPFVEAKVFVPVVQYDATSFIQAAIDYVSELDPDENGFRGAVLLDKGNFYCSGRLNIKVSGVVLRGSGSGSNGTTLIAEGINRETFLRIEGVANREIDAEIQILDTYLPVNAMSVTLPPKHGITKGNKIILHKPFTKEWVDVLNMNEFGGETGWLGWKPDRMDLFWDVSVVKVNGNTVFFDSPLTTAIDQTYGGGFVKKYTWPGRIDNIGIENLKLESTYEKNNSKDEDHCWFAISVENAENCWVRQVRFENFAGSAVAVFESAKKITVEDCISEHPVSEIGGQRRYTFFTQGQQTLFQRCYAENGYHDFAAGYAAAGPNVFLQCESKQPHSFSGTIDRWASGVLFDIVNIDGEAICFKNLEAGKQGAGWTAANSMIWQCSASKVECYSPPTAQNWAYGIWAQFAGNAFWHEANSHVKPRSLYTQQLKERTGRDKNEFLLPVSTGETSSPTISEAAEYAFNSLKPPLLLKDWIAQASVKNAISLDHKKAIIFKDKNKNKEQAIQVHGNIEIKNGWITSNNLVLTGKIIGNTWWRGNARPDFVSESTPHITRYVPGRHGLGYTDNPDETVDFMKSNRVIAFDHNYGLWYDRRRDDHERVRRMNGEVWPPFYELPFARSGEGLAWDGLSKYDLTKYNPWYWNRLKDFANQAEKEGLLLIHQNYFQHNLLEAGAHWADFPWRTANNINNTGFPEPPPYAGDKRIFMAGLFYNTNDVVQKDLHNKYIRQCLNNFSDNSNVIQMIGEEYTGPLHFMEFWVDVILAWEKETGKSQWIALSATKDVQDAILIDPIRSKAVDIIHIKYWHYRDDQTVYQPEGGQNLAPRQHARLVKPGKSDFEAIYRAVAEYKVKFPDKAIIYSANGYMQHEWAVFMAGGSLAAIPEIKDKGFLTKASDMMPVSTSTADVKILSNNNKEYIFYLRSNQNMMVNLDKEMYQIVYINPEDGNLISTQKVNNKENIEIKGIDLKDVVVWIGKVK